MRLWLVVASLLVLLPVSAEAAFDPTATEVTVETHLCYNPRAGHGEDKGDPLGEDKSFFIVIVPGVKADEDSSSEGLGAGVDYGCQPGDGPLSGLFGESS